MSFHLEWERLFSQRFDMLGVDDKMAIAMALTLLARQGIPGEAEAGDDGRWTLRAGRHIVVFTEHELDIYLLAIEDA